MHTQICCAGKMQLCVLRQTVRDVSTIQYGAGCTWRQHHTVWGRLYMTSAPYSMGQAVRDIRTIQYGAGCMWRQHHTVWGRLYVTSALYSKGLKGGAKSLFILFFYHQILNDKLLRRAAKFITKCEYQITCWKAQVYVLLIYFVMSHLYLMAHSDI